MPRDRWLPTQLPTGKGQDKATDETGEALEHQMDLALMLWTAEDYSASGCFQLQADGTSSGVEHSEHGCTSWRTSSRLH